MVSYLSKDNKKHYDIVNRVLAGETYESISNSWNITRERVRQIANQYNVKSLSYNEKPLNDKEKTILDILINEPLLSYAEISKHYGFSGYMLRRIAKKTNVEWIRYPIYKRQIQNWDYEIDEDTGCWHWKHGIHALSGQGRLRVNDRIEYAHRYMYNTAVKEISNNEIIYQICNNKLCINPDHLKSSFDDLDTQLC